MNLKEAFRYQNKLQSLLDEAQGILDCDANVTKVANTYLRHKVMPEAEDETVMDATARSMLQMMDTAPKKGFDLTVTDPADVTGFLRYMLEAGRTERVAG